MLSPEIRCHLVASIFAEPGFPKNGLGIPDSSMPEASVTRIVRVTSAELEETSTLVGEAVIPSGNSGLSASAFELVTVTPLKLSPSLVEYIDELPQVSYQKPLFA